MHVSELGVAIQRLTILFVSEVIKSQEPVNWYGEITKYT